MRFGGEANAGLVLLRRSCAFALALGSERVAFLAVQLLFVGFHRTFFRDRGPRFGGGVGRRARHGQRAETEGQRTGGDKSGFGEGH